MKSLICALLLFFLSSNYLLAQESLPLDSATKEVTYSEVVHVKDSASAKELFDRAKNWFTRTYNSSNDVIQDMDKELCSITGKAIIRTHIHYVGERTWGQVKYTISVFCKDGKFKYIINDFYHTGDTYASAGSMLGDVGSITVANELFQAGETGRYYREKDFVYLRSQIMQNISGLIASLKESMNTISQDKSGW